MQAIRPCLWCIDNAEEVADLYTSISPPSQQHQAGNEGRRRAGSRQWGGHPTSVAFVGCGLHR